MRRGTMISAAGVGLVLVGGLAAPASADDARRERVEAPTAAFTALSVDNDSGAVRVRAGDTAKVEIAEWWSLVEPTVTVRTEKGVLTVIAECPDLDLAGVGQVAIPMNNCRVDLAITVPASTATTIGVGAGSAVVSGIASDTRVRTGAGSVGLERVRANVVAVNTGVGSISMKDVSAAKATATTGSGTIALDLATPPSSVEARAGSGSVDVGVPVGSYAITTRSASGDDQVVGLVNDPSSPRTIVATASAGNVNVHARKPAA